MRHLWILVHKLARWRWVFAITVKRHIVRSLLWQEWIVDHVFSLDILFVNCYSWGRLFDYFIVSFINSIFLLVLHQFPLVFQHLFLRSVLLWLWREVFLSSSVWVPEACCILSRVHFRHGNGRLSRCKDYMTVSVVVFLGKHLDWQSVTLKGTFRHDFHHFFIWGLIALLNEVLPIIIQWPLADSILHIFFRLWSYLIWIPSGWPLMLLVELSILVSWLLHPWIAQMAID